MVVVVDLVALVGLLHPPLLLSNKIDQPLISALLKAGAHWDVADKRGVRASDLAGWTDVVHPAVTVPLQDAIQQLRRRNVQLNDHIASLNARARSLLDGADAVRCAATELSLEVEVNRRYRNDIDAGIEVSQRELLVLQDAVAAEGPELERLQSDIAAVEAQRAVAAAQVESEREVIRDLHQQREGLDRQRGELECERARIKAEGAVKGEVVALTRSQLAGGGSSKRSFVVLSLRAMVALASRPGNGLIGSVTYRMQCGLTKLLDASKRVGGSCSVATLAVWRLTRSRGSQTTRRSTSPPAD